MPSVGDDENDNLIEDLNWINDSNNFLDESINYINDSQNDMDMLVIINLENPQPSHPSTDINDVDKLQANFLNKIKNISAKNKINVGKRKARRYENGICNFSFLSVFEKFGFYSFTNFSARQLDLIADADADGIDIDDLMPFNCTFRFSKILEDSDLTNKVFFFFEKFYLQTCDIRRAW